MTRLESVLGLLLLASSGWAVRVHRRYLALQRKHKLLQHLHDKAEQQLSTFWSHKKS